MSAVLLCLALLGAPDGTLEIADAVLRIPPGGTGSGALYLTVKNRGPEDRLLAASTKAARHTMLHETVIEGDVAKMVHAKSWPVPAEGTLVLAPGKKHVMLMGMSGTKPGDEVVVVLRFERAGERRVVVRARSIAE